MDKLNHNDAGGNLFARYWSVPWHAHVVPVVVALLISGLWLTSDGRMMFWAISWSAIMDGQIALFLLHMLAHGGLPHLILNVAAILLIGGPLISRLGRPPIAWARYLYLFVGSGICGALLFLMLKANDTAAMLGASGAIFGTVGALTRVHPLTGAAVSIRSPRTWLLAKFFVQNHVLILALLAVVALLSGSWPSVGWEAHLGGLLFGFLATPLYLPSPDPD